MINSKVKMKLIKRGITQKKAAQDLGISENRFRRIICGFESPKQVIEKIARYLDLAPETINRNYNGEKREKIQDIV